MRSVPPKPYVLTHAILCQALGDPEFYKHVPVFLFLRASGVKAYEAYLQQVQQGICAGCREIDVMGAVLATFMSVLHLHWQEGPEHLAGICRYLAIKRECSIERCAVYYRPAGVMIRLEF